MAGVDELSCPTCDRPIRPVPGYESRTVYCSPRCEDRAWRRRRKAEMKRLRAENETARGLIRKLHELKLAHDAVEGELADFDVHHAAVDRLVLARMALNPESLTDAEVDLLASIEGDE